MDKEKPGVIELTHELAEKLLQQTIDKEGIQRAVIRAAVKAAEESGCDRCFDPLAKSDLTTHGNHFCLNGSRVPPEDVHIAGNGEYHMRRGIPGREKMPSETDLHHISLQVETLKWASSHGWGS